MINTIETMGFMVNSISPSKFAADVSVNSVIKIEFNSEIDKRSLSKCITVYEDTRNVYSASSTFRPSSYRKVLGEWSQKGRVIEFEPVAKLKDSIRYIVHITKADAYDILMRGMRSDFISTFETERFATLPECNILFPENNSIIRILNKVTIEDLGTSAITYILQISRVATFENTIYESTERLTEFTDFNFGDGLYFIRARASNGDFGPTIVVTVQSRDKTTVTDQDDDEGFIYVPLDDEEDVKFLFDSNVPEGLANKTNLNVLYSKLNENVPLEEIDFFECSVVGETIDKDDSDNNHGEVDGSFIRLYSKLEGKTYIIFSPVDLEV